MWQRQAGEHHGDDAGCGHRVTANFVRNPRSLTLAVNDSSVGGAVAGNGSISSNPGGRATGTFAYVYGDEVTLTATADLTRLEV